MKSMNRYLVTGLSNHNKDVLSATVGVEVIKHIPQGRWTVNVAEYLHKYIFAI